MRAGPPGWASPMHAALRTGRFRKPADGCGCASVRRRTRILPAAGVARAWPHRSGVLTATRPSVCVAGSWCRFAMRSTECVHCLRPVRFQQFPPPSSPQVSSVFAEGGATLRACRRARGIPQAGFPARPHTAPLSGYQALDAKCGLAMRKRATSSERRGVQALPGSMRTGSGQPAGVSPGRR
jgi:hypothetical protein